MKPEIIGTRFGGITFNKGGNRVEYQRDVMVGLDGKVRKRKKKLSKQVYGTSHTVSLAEAEHIHEDGSEWLLVGTGMFGMLNLSDEAVDFFRDKGVQVQLQPTPKAALLWNEMQGKVLVQQQLGILVAAECT
jgi:hypothetical protein